MPGDIRLPESQEILRVRVNPHDHRDHHRREKQQHGGHKNQERRAQPVDGEFWAYIFSLPIKALAFVLFLPFRYGYGAVPAYSKVAARRLNMRVSTASDPEPARSNGPLPGAG